MLDYKLLEAYAAVISEGGFEKAAGKIHITQSAVSQRVKQLEETFGQVLLLRTTPPVPTDPGKKVLKLYHQVKHLEDDFQLSIQSDDEKTTYTSIPIGVNADTLDTWFFRSIEPFLTSEKVVLDLFVDDQEKTHQFLRDGKVLGCISTRSSALQGCRVDYIGEVSYGLYASKDFADKWFPRGVEFARLHLTPCVCFTRDDELNATLFRQIFGKVPQYLPTHYVPSTIMFVEVIRKGIAYGMLPEQQSQPLIEAGDIVDVTPHEKVSVQLYWHCWNLQSKLLQDFSKELLRGFKKG